MLRLIRVIVIMAWCERWWRRFGGISIRDVLSEGGEVAQDFAWFVPWPAVLLVCSQL